MTAFCQAPCGTVKLIFISGLPGVGKLTVAKRLAELTGLPLFHNHLTVDLLLSVFAFGSPPFVELRESIWLSVFEHSLKANLPGLIFTFNAENSVRQSFIDKTVEMFAAHRSRVYFVELACSEVELERRMHAPSRHEYKKMTSWSDFQRLKAAGIFDSPKLPPAELALNTDQLDPLAAAKRIAAAIHE